MRVALDLQTSQALFARIFEYLDLKPAIADAPDAAPGRRRRELGRVEFDDVVVPLPGCRGRLARRPSRACRFAIEPGQYAAFVGPSGAGKTTVSYLMPRLHEVTGGRVLFAGDDVREPAAGRRSSRTSASSARRPTSSTPRSPRTCATRSRMRRDAELEAAAQAANIHDTIASFPDGYDTVVGERGYRL